MSVLKYYNVANAAWETAIVGAQGATGATGPGVTPGGSNTYVQFNDDGALGGTDAFTFDKDSNLLEVHGNAFISGNSVAIGPGANTLVASLANAVLVASSNAEPYIQATLLNVSDNGSADWAAQGHHGDDDGGWADMGFTSSGFNDSNYTITGPGDGYLFAQSYYTGQAPGLNGGNLVIATGENGTVNDIIFATGGFLTSNEFARISNANNALELTRTGSKITIAGTDGNISSSANLNLTADTNTWTFDTNGNLTLPNDANIAIYGNTTQFNTCANGVLGLNSYDDGSNNIAHISLSSTDKAVFIGTYDTVTENDYNWKFDDTGNLTLPGNTFAVNYANGTQVPLGGGGANTGNVTFDNINIIGTGNLHLQPDPANSGSYLDIFLSSGPDIHIVASASANLILGKDDQSNVMTSWDGNVYIQSWDSNTNTQGGVWTFGGDGNFTITSGGAIKSGNLSIASSNGIGTISSIIEDNGLLNIFGSGNGACVAIGWQSDYSNGAGDTTQIYFNPAGNNGNIIVTTGNTSGTLYDWNFDNTGNLTLPGGGTIFGDPYTPSGAPGNTITLQPAGSGTITDQRLLIYPTAGDGDHIHMVTGNLYQTELFLGSDLFFAKLANTGNFVVQTNDGNSNISQYLFGYDGNFNLPGNLTINGLTSVFGSNTALIQTNDDIPIAIISSNANGTISSVWIENTSDVGNSNIAGIYVHDTGTGAVRIVNGNNATAINIWDFGTDGIITLPGEGILQSIDDTVTLRSKNSNSNVVNGIYIGTSGGLGFFDSSIPGNWLEIFRSGVDPQIATIGNLLIRADSTNTAPTWTFGYNGDLTVPGNILCSNLASPSPYISGFSSISLNGTGTVVNASSGNILTNEVTGTKFNFLNGSYTATVTGSGATANYSLNLPANAGSNGQVLSTDGAGNLSWISAGGGSYGDSNVVTLLGSFGSNTITTTGNISGGHLLASANVLSNGYARFSGSFDESQASTAGLYLGYAGGTPRMMFGTGNTSQTFEIDNDGGDLRFYQPGSTKATLTSAGDFSVIGNITAATVKTTPVTLASLPAANTAGMGTRAFINDSNVVFNGTSLGTIAVNGGSNAAPVYSDGTDWRLG